MVGVSNALMSSGLSPVKVAWCGLRPLVRTTSPPKDRTAATVVTPIWPCGMDAASSSTVNPLAHSTETPVVPLG